MSKKKNLEAFAGYLGILLGILSNCSTQQLFIHADKLTDVYFCVSLHAKHLCVSKIRPTGVLCTLFSTHKAVSLCVYGINPIEIHWSVHNFKTHKYTSIRADWWMDGQSVCWWMNGWEAFTISPSLFKTRGPWWPCNAHLSNIALWEPDLELIKANILIKVQNDYNKVFHWFGPVT